MSPIDEDDLRTLLQGVDPVAPHDSAARAIGRGTTVRRRRQVLAGALAAVVVVGGVGVGLSLLRPDAGPAPAHTASPSPTASAPSTLPVNPTTAPTDSGATTGPSGGTPPPSPQPTGPSSTPSASGSAPSASGSAPGASSAISTANLATASDLSAILSLGHGVGTPTDYPAGDWGQAAASLCQRTQALGQSSTRLRTFSAIDVTVVALGFKDAATASSARATIVGWYKNCASQSSGSGGAVRVDAQWTGTRLPLTASGASPINATVGAVSVADTGSGGVFEDAVVVQAGNRVEWVIQRNTGQDNNCSLLANDPTTGQCGVFASANNVAKRLMK